MNSPRTYRHPNCLDVDMRIVRQCDATEDAVEFNVIWVSRTCGPLASDTVWVKISQFPDWTPV